MFLSGSCACKSICVPLSERIEGIKQEIVKTNALYKCKIRSGGIQPYLNRNEITPGSSFEYCERLFCTLH